MAGQGIRAEEAAVFHQPWQFMHIPNHASMQRLPNLRQDPATTPTRSTLPTASPGAIPLLLTPLSSLRFCGSVDSHQGADPALGAMASASQSQVFVAPDTGPQAPAFVVAAASVTKHMYGSIVRLITDRYPDARITAIDARTLSNLHERQRHQLKRFNASTRRTPEEKRLLMTIRKPVTTVDLFRDRHGDEPRLVVLRGHALSGSEKLSGIRFSKIAAALKANGLQNHDVITLTACFGADSLNFNSADIAELDRSSMGYENKGRKVLPPAQNLANALGDVGLPGCLVVASHNVHSEWPSKSRKTRKIMFDERNGQQFSATMDGLHHSSLADASRIFRCNAAPSKLLTKLDAAERERVEPAIAYLRSVKPPELPTAFSPPAA